MNQSLNLLHLLEHKQELYISESSSLMFFDNVPETYKEYKNTGRNGSRFILDYFNCKTMPRITNWHQLFLLC